MSGDGATMSERERIAEALKQKCFFESHGIGCGDEHGPCIYCEAAALLRAEPVGDGWLPTPENINALPMPLRDYIHRLETRCDPAGEVRELVIAKDTIRALEAERGAEPVGEPVAWIDPDDLARLRDDDHLDDARVWNYEPVLFGGKAIPLYTRPSAPTEGGGPERAKCKCYVERQGHGESTGRWAVNDCPLHEQQPHGGRRDRVPPVSAAGEEERDGR